MSKIALASDNTEAGFIARTCVTLFETGFNRSRVPGWEGSEDAVLHFCSRPVVVFMLTTQIMYFVGAGKAL